MGEAAILLTKTNAITVTTYRELPSFNNYWSGTLYMIGGEVCWVGYDEVAQFYYEQLVQLMLTI